MLSTLLRDQRFRFLLIGGCNTVFSTMLFAELVHALPASAPSSVSLVISWAVSMVVGFVAYRRFVFQVKGRLWLDFARFTGTNVTSLLINIFALTLLTDIIGLPAVPVQIFVTCIVVISNYFGHKHVSFRRSL